MRTHVIAQNPEDVLDAVRFNFFDNAVSTRDYWNSIAYNGGGWKVYRVTYTAEEVTSERESVYAQERETWDPTRRYTVKVTEPDGSSYYLLDWDARAEGETWKVQKASAFQRRTPDGALFYARLRVGQDAGAQFTVEEV